MHTSVLLQESIDGLNLSPGKIALDGTLGGGGHSLLIANKISPNGFLIALDRDPVALKRGGERLKDSNCKFEILNENFRNLDRALLKTGIRKADAILLDIGVSSFQFDDEGRGFSFRKDEPLSMAMEGESAELTAYDVVNEWSEESLADIIYGYGEEKFARRIAKAVLDKRERSSIKTTGELAEIIKSAYPAKLRNGKIHPATKTFQAIRIAVNDELGSLSEALPKAVEALSVGGRLAVISFHSLEDRIVKNFFKEAEKESKVRIITKKPIVPCEEEEKSNPRARSAKLRIAEKI